jgi:hypothetical protein
VVEDALLYSKNSVERHLQDIFHSVSGICFLGTPHCGSDIAKWGSILGSLVRIFKNANVKLVNLLTRESEVLARVQQDFHTMIRGSANGKNLEIGITCFFEGLPIRGIGEVRDVLMLANCVRDLMIPPNRLFPNSLQYSRHIPLSAFTPITWTWQSSAASRIQDTGQSVVRYDDGSKQQGKSNISRGSSPISSVENLSQNNFHPESTSQRIHHRTCPNPTTHKPEPPSKHTLSCAHTLTPLNW